jgi:hypothetical protein
MAQNFETTDNKSIMREYITMLHMAAIYQCTLKDYKDVRSRSLPSFLDSA